MHQVNEYLLTGVVIFGGGISGCLAAIKAAEYGSDVILIDQGIMSDRKNRINSNIKKAL